VEDNWKHRSSKMRCDSCMWYAEKRPENAEKRPEKEADSSSFGRCRRHAPTMNGFPAVFGTDWCGDHKVDENKL
jgi:hypothetical protein